MRRSVHGRWCVGLRNQPAFLSTVCHCLGQAASGQLAMSSTASAKQWHTCFGGDSASGTAQHKGWQINRHPIVQKQPPYRRLLSVIR